MTQPKLRFKADDGAKFPDWEKNNFSDVFDSINNSTFSRDCLNYVDGNVKYIHYGDILTAFDSTVNVEASDVPYVNKDIDCQKYQLLADGDIIVADTAEDDTVGKAVEIVNASNVKVISGLHTIACRPKLKFTSGYLGYYMNSNSYHNQLHPYMQGIKVTSISKANIALTNISIPSLPEQQKIASLFAELDTLIQSAQKELDGYRELKQGMLQKMFPKKGEMFPEVRFPEFTGDWEQCKLGDIVTQISTGLNPRDNFTLNTGGNNYYVTIKNFEQGILHLDEKCDLIDDNALKLIQARSNLEKDDILFSSIGRVGDCYLIKHTPENWNINESVFSLRPNKSKVAPEYLSHTIHSNIVLSQILNNVTGSTFKSIKIGDLKKIIIPTPSLEEQKKIGEYFSNIDNLITLQQKELDGYKELKKGLLQQMFC